ncbi:HIT domain-containing protein [bacterium]|nr:HIT domain-containing protein [bacterium]MBU1153726.1 HIT domain-containing protein [bacterium]MBU2599542.1 HIT domain-containing protein [bacterium]
MYNNLFVPSKSSYVRGIRPDVKCILCAVRDYDSKVEHLDIYRSKEFIVSLNLHPYNPGHIIIFPKEHILDTRELKPEQVLELFNILSFSLNKLEELYQPQGFNIGFNIREAGASIDHLHLHVVPRYKSEVGFIEVLSGTRIIVEDPHETKKKLIDAYKRCI